MTGPANAIAVHAETPAAPPALLLHGIGLGAWLWERDQPLLADRGVSTWAIDLPGHGRDVGDTTLDACVDAVLAAVDAFDEPPLIVGHSAGGLIAQIVASRVPVAGVALVAPVPCNPVPYLPTRRGLATIRPGMALALLRGRGIPVGRKAYVATGLDMLAPADQERFLARVTDWPRGLVLDVAARRPRLDPLPVPVLVTHGLQDGVASLYGSRLLADHHDAVLWRFDDLAHVPQVEPGGERHAQALADWLLAPHGRRVREIDAFRPDEGIGLDARRSRDPLPARSDSRFGDRRKR